MFSSETGLPSGGPVSRAAHDGPVCTDLDAMAYGPDR